MALAVASRVPASQVHLKRPSVLWLPTSSQMNDSLVEVTGQVCGLRVLVWLQRFRSSAQ